MGIDATSGKGYVDTREMYGAGATAAKPATVEKKQTEEPKAPTILADVPKDWKLESQQSYAKDKMGPMFTMPEKSKTPDQTYKVPGEEKYKQTTLADDFKQWKKDLPDEAKIAGGIVGFAIGKAKIKVPF